MVLNIVEGDGLHSVVATIHIIKVKSYSLTIIFLAEVSCAGRFLVCSNLLLSIDIQVLRLLAPTHCHAYFTFRKNRRERDEHRWFTVAALGYITSYFKTFLGTDISTSFNIHNILAIFFDWNHKFSTFTWNSSLKDCFFRTIFGQDDSYRSIYNRAICQTVMNGNIHVDVFTKMFYRSCLNIVFEEVITEQLVCHIWVLPAELIDRNIVESLPNNLQATSQPVPSTSHSFLSECRDIILDCIFPISYSNVGLG